MRHLLPFLCLAALACDSTSDKGVTTGTMTDPTAPMTTTTPSPTGSTTSSVDCNRSISFSLPVDGEPDHYFRDRLLMALNPPPEADEMLVLELMEADGTPLSGTSQNLPEGLEFVPDEGLVSETDYVLYVEACPNLSVAFQTGALGDPVDPALVVGQGYSLDLVAANWVEPAGVGALIPTLGFEQLLVGPVDADASYLDLVGAMAIPGTSTQDTCLESVDFPSADFLENPYFQVGPADFTISANGVTVNVYEASLQGVFTPAGDQILRGELDGVLDVAVLGSLIGVDVCDLLLALGAPCSFCPNGIDESCIGIRVMDITAFGGLPAVLQVTQADIDADPTCQYSTGTTATTP